MQIDQLTQALKLFEAYNTSKVGFSLDMIRVFLFIATNDRPIQNTIIHSLNIPSPTLNRVISDLSKRTRKQALICPGLDLIEREENEQDMRQKPLILTKKGKKLLEELQII